MNQTKSEKRQVFLSLQTLFDSFVFVSVPLFFYSFVFVQLFYEIAININLCLLLNNIRDISFRFTIATARTQMFNGSRQKNQDEKSKCQINSSCLFFEVMLQSSPMYISISISAFISLSVCFLLNCN